MDNIERNIKSSTATVDRTKRRGLQKSNYLSSFTEIKLTNLTKYLLETFVSKHYHTMDFFKLNPKFNSRNEFKENLMRNAAAGWLQNLQMLVLGELELGGQDLKELLELCNNLIQVIVTKNGKITIHQQKL